MTLSLIVKYFKFFLSVADTESSTEEEKRQHGFLLYLGFLMSFGGVIWGSICYVQELYTPAIVPLIYIIITILNFSYLYATKNFIVAQNVQITISLLLPFFFQYFLGGFVASGGNVLWSILAVFGSFTLRRRRATIVWLVLFIVIMIVSGVVDESAKRFDAGLSDSLITFFFVTNFIITTSIVFTLYYYFVRSEEKARKSLHDSLEELKMTQERLVESEKMAALGSLVSGIAHEINTPLGVGLTGVSQIDHEIKKLELSHQEERLTEEALIESIGVIKQLTHMIRDRLNNAVTLVKSFKNIAVDQHFEDKRFFNLKQYTDDLLLSLHNPLKSKQVKVVTSIDEGLNIESYPGMYSQILTNFILNSIKHGFEESDGNVIKISVQLERNDLIMRYEDNGVGIADEIEKKIFDPFFTTKRGQGGSGLGMSIVYNLVVQKFGGSIQVIRVRPHGLGFTIKMNISKERV